MNMRMKHVGYAINDLKLSEIKKRDSPLFFIEKREL
jgi:hypothetical protein